MRRRKNDLPDYPAGVENPLGSCHQEGTFFSTLQHIGIEKQLVPISEGVVSHMDGPVHHPLQFSVVSASAFS